MRELIKKGIIICVSTLVLAGLAIPTASAQIDFDKAFFTSILEANHSFSSVKVEGTVQLRAASDDQTADLGKVKFTAGGNVNPLSGSLEGTFESLFLGGKQLFYAYLQNSVFYVGYPNENGETEWEALDVPGIEKEYEKAIAQRKEVGIPIDSELMYKYFDVTEEGTNYVFKLNQNIDANELWMDIIEAVDVEEFKAENIRQYEEETGEEVTDEVRQEIEEMYNVESLAEMWLAMNPTFEIFYDKDSKLLTGINVLVNIKFADLMEDSEQYSEIGLPEEFSVKVELNFSEHNQEQTITIPEEAMNPKFDLTEQI